MMLLLFKASLVAIAVLLASLAGRIWGHRASGWIGGLPLIAGPITFFLAIDLGAEFGQRSAHITLQTISAAAFHCVIFSSLSRRFRWPVCIAGAWAGFFAWALALRMLPMPPALSLLLSLTLLLTLYRLISRPQGEHVTVSAPPAELAARLTFGVTLAMVITLGAPFFGSAFSGVLLSLPLTGTVLPIFALALHGRDAALHVLRGFVLGLCSFSMCFYVLATYMVRWGIGPTFLAAIVVGAICARLMVLALQRMALMR